SIDSYDARGGSMTRRLAAALLLILAVNGSGAFAQGVQTGTITGIVQSADGLSLPGVTATAVAPQLQGQRSAITDVNGVYITKGLPAGTYAVTFELSNFQPIRRENVALGVGATTEVNITMALAARAESVTVSAALPSPIAVVTVSQAFTKRDVDLLP